MKLVTKQQQLPIQPGARIGFDPATGNLTVCEPGTAGIVPVLSIERIASGITTVYAYTHVPVVTKERHIFEHSHIGIAPSEIVHTHYGSFTFTH